MFKKGLPSFVIAHHLYVHAQEMRIILIDKGRIKSLFVKACPSCNYLKAHTHTQYGFLEPLHSAYKDPKSLWCVCVDLWFSLFVIAKYNMSPSNSGGHCILDVFLISILYLVVQNLGVPVNSCKRICVLGVVQLPAFLPTPENGRFDSQGFSCITITLLNIQFSRITTQVAFEPLLLLVAVGNYWTDLLKSVEAWDWSTLFS